MGNDIKWFRSEKSDREIALNTNTKEMVIVKLPTTEQIESILQAHEEAVISDIWENRFSIEYPDKGYIEAFSASRGGSLQWLSHNAINHHLNTNKIRGLGEDIRALSLPEQRQLLEKIKTTSRSKFESIASTYAIKNLLGANLRNELLSRKSVEEFIKFLFTRATAPRDSSYTRSGGAEQAIEVLLMLRAGEYVLFPIQFRAWHSTVKWRAALNPKFSGHLAGMMSDIGKLLARPYSDMLATLGQSCVLMCSINSINDLSAPLIDEMEKILEQVKTRTSYARNIAAAFRELWNEKNPDLLFERTRTEKRTNERKDLRTSGEFGWVGLRNPDMVAWQKPLASFIEQREATSKQAVIADLNYFIDFLSDHPNPPLKPEQVDRIKHIRDVTFQNTQTLMKHLEKSELNTKRRNRILSYAREFFDWYHDFLVAQEEKLTASLFKNPVSVLDGFKGDISAGQTYRTALPSWLLRELRKTLTDDDFYFVKSGKQHDWYNLRDRYTDEIVSLWWPGTATILTLLLDLPIRGHQARWLDSGEFDDVFFNLQDCTEHPNFSTQAMRGRREGCLRLLHDSLRQESWPGAYVNTNKTALYKSDANGYEIPYLAPELATLLDNIRQWNRRYLPPLRSLVTYQEEGRGRIQFAQTDPAKLPQIAPLFRDPGSPQKNRPPGSPKIGQLWVRVLHETEQRIQRERGVEIQLTELNEAGNRVWKYDLHTLRVSGISAMIENGVPLEVVSKFIAGHMTLVMTLWYFKSSPGKIREIIAEAHERALADGDFVGGKDFQNNIEKFSPYLLSKNALLRFEEGDVAYEALKAHTGLWSIGSDGICPGTSCATGGEPDDDSKSYGPVPGGRRCGLCRYWITGPAFLLGQMAEANNLIYTIRKKGTQLKEARDELIEHEDAGKDGLARQVRSRVEVLERELELDLLEWQARYNYALNSSALLDEYVKTRNSMDSAENLPAPLLTANSESELKLTLMEADEFVLLDHVTQLSGVMTGFKNREATLEKHTILSKVLAENGLPPLLLTLEPKQAEVVGNLLSSMLLQYVEAQDRSRLFSGEMKLSEIPALEGPLNDLISTKLIKGPSRKTIPIDLAS